MHTSGARGCAARHHGRGAHAARLWSQLLGRNVKGERLRKMMYDDLRGERTVRAASTWKELSSLGQINPWRV